MRSDLCVYDMEEIFRGHIGCLDRGDTIAATMEAMDITTERGFPKELAKRVQFLEVTAAERLQPEC